MLCFSNRSPKNLATGTKWAKQKYKETNEKRAALCQLTTCETRVRLRRVCSKNLFAVRTTKYTRINREFVLCINCTPTQLPLCRHTTTRIDKEWGACVLTHSYSNLPARSRWWPIVKFQEKCLAPLCIYLVRMPKVHKMKKMGVWVSV